MEVTSFHMFASLIIDDSKEIIHVPVCHKAFFWFAPAVTLNHSHTFRNKDKRDFANDLKMTDAIKTSKFHHQNENHEGLLLYNNSEAERNEVNEWLC